MSNKELKRAIQSALKQGEATIMIFDNGLKQLKKEDQKNERN
jgi:hypothetical protein